MDDDLLLLLNAHHEAVQFSLPEGPWGVLLDSARLESASAEKRYALEARSLALIARPRRTGPARTDG